MQYKHYMDLDPHELHNVLMKRRGRDYDPNSKKGKLLDIELDHIKAVVAEQQAKLKSENAKSVQLKAYWQQLIEPMIVERKIIRSMLNYKAKDEEDPRYLALTVYAMLLDRLKASFENNWKQHKTLPTKLGKEKNLPNGGIHWTDWVPNKQRQTVIDLFNAIPYTAKAKRKAPFARVIPFDMHVALKDRLINRTLKELETLERENEVDRDLDKMERIAKIRSALEKIEQMQNNEPVPHTWHWFEETRG